MIVSNCPRCGEPYRFPSGNVPDDAQVQCPWCRESFAAAEVNAKLPPVVSLKSAAGLPLSLDDLAPGVRDVGRLGPGGYELAAREVAGGREVAGLAATDFETHPVAGTDTAALVDEADEGAEFLTDDTVTHVEEANFDSDEDLNESLGVPVPENGESSAASAAVTGPRPVARDELQPMRVNAGPTRRSRKKSSPVKSFLGVVIGGLCALPIAGGILLAAGKAPVLGFYPFDGSFNSDAPRQASRPSVRRGSTGDRQRPRRSTAQPGRSLGDELEPWPGTEDAPDREALDQLGINGDAAEKKTEPREQSGASSSPSDGEFEMPTEPTAETGLSLPDLPLADLSEQASRADAPMRVEGNANEQPVAEPAEAEPASEPEMSSSGAASVAPGSSASANEPAAMSADASPEVEAAAAPRRRDAKSDSDKLRAATAKARQAAEALEATAAGDSGYGGRVRDLYIAAAESAEHVASPRSLAAGELLEQLDRLEIGEIIDKAARQWIGLPKSNRPTNGILLYGEFDAGGSVLTSPSGKEFSVATELLDSVPAGRVLGLGKITATADGETVVITATTAGE